MKVTTLASEEINRKRWTSQEDRVLKEEYPLKGAAQVAQMLERTLESIQARAKYLEVERLNHKDVYGEKVKELANHGFTIPEAAKSLKISKDSIRHIAEVMNLTFESGAKTKVDKKAIELGIEDNKPLPKNKNKITFSDYFKHWYNTYRKEGISETTKYSYRNVFYHTRDGRLGEKKLIKLTRADIQNYINDYGYDRSKQTVFDHMQYIRSCLKDAVIDGYIENNPAGNITPVYKEQRLSVTEQKKLREKKRWLEVDEYQKLRYFLVFELKRILKEDIINSGPRRSVQTSHQISNMVKFVGLKTGARLSEILGITKDDISFEADTINIDKTWDYKGDEDGRFKKLKTNQALGKFW